MILGSQVERFGELGAPIERFGELPSGVPQCPFSAQEVARLYSGESLLRAPPFGAPAHLWICAPCTRWRPHARYDLTIDELTLVKKMHMTSRVLG